MVSPGMTSWPAPSWKPSCRHATTAAVCKQITTFTRESYYRSEHRLLECCVFCQWHWQRKPLAWGAKVYVRLQRVLRSNAAHQPENVFSPAVEQV